MQLAALIEDIFKRIGREWKVGDKLISPNKDDINTVLDEAIDRLYTESVGSRLEKGGLIIEKTYNGHDIYVMVGEIN